MLMFGGSSPDMVADWEGQRDKSSEAGPGPDTSETYQVTRRVCSYFPKYPAISSREITQTQS